MSSTKPMYTKTSNKDRNFAFNIMPYYDVLWRTRTYCKLAMCPLCCSYTQREKKNFPVKCCKFAVEETVTMALLIGLYKLLFLRHNKGEMAKGSQLFNLPIPTTASKIARYLK